MKTEEIKSIFGIDITEKKRTPLLVALRSFYAVDRINELSINKKLNLSNIYNTIAVEINLTSTMVYKLIEKREYFINDKQYSELFLAYKNKDKKQFDYFIKLLKDIKKENKLNYSERKLEIAKEKLSFGLEVKEIKKDYLKLTNLDIASFLRANKNLKSPAWDIPVKRMSSDNFKSLRNINRKFFDELVDSKK